MSTTKISKILGTTFSKSKSGGNAARGGRWTTEGYTVDTYTITSVAVTYEHDDTVAYDETVTIANLTAYAAALEAAGYETIIKSDTVPFLIVKNA